MKPVMKDRWDIIIACLQTRWQLQCCGLIDDAHARHISINHSKEAADVGNLCQMIVEQQTLSIFSS
jgi:hypothetical protein